MSTTFTLDTSTSRANPTPAPMKRLTVPAIQRRKVEGKTDEPLVMLTAYTARQAQLLDPHCDMLLVGDSLGQVIYGLPSTLAVTLNQHRLVCQAPDKERHYFDDETVDWSAPDHERDYTAPRRARVHRLLGDGSRLGVSFWICLPLSGAVAALLGGLIGWPVLLVWMPNPAMRS